MNHDVLRIITSIRSIPWVNSISTLSMFSRAKIVVAVVLIVFGVVGRLLLQDLPNIETITVVSLLAGSLLGGVWTVVVGLAVVAITDMVIGNTMIALYTWSAWAVMGMFGWVVRYGSDRTFRHVAALTGMGLLGNVFFYLWTNFGVWHIGGLYPQTLNGLWWSYIMGLPFLKYQLISTLVIVPSVSAVAVALWNRFAVPVALSQKIVATSSFSVYGRTDK